MRSARRVRRVGALLILAACTPARQPTAVPAKTVLVVEQRVEHLDEVAREPMIVEHPSGALFAAGYGADTPTLWKSADRGASWSRVDVGTEANGAIGNSDVDLAVARDGTIYFASMLYDREKDEGVAVAVGVSRDIGATWSWTQLSRHRFDDRPWVAVASDGTAHVIWNDGDGVLHAVSHDRGATWQARARVHDAGGSSHLATGPRGEVAVRITPFSASGNKASRGVDLVAVSTDGGETWTKHPAPGALEWNYDDQWNDASPKFVARWVEPLAWDAGGALYSLWGDLTGVSLARSTDAGAHWQSWRIARGGRSFFPYVIAGAPGELAATWFSGAGDAMRWNLARITLDAGDAPRVLAATPQPIECFARKTNARDACGEYGGVAMLADGSVGAVTTIQNRPQSRMGFTWWRFEAR
jgi:hypothetical protein